MKYILLIGLIGLSGCMHYSKNVCPQPFYFSKEEELKAAGEVHNLPDDSSLIDMFLKLNRNNEYLKGLQ